MARRRVRLIFGPDLVTEPEELDRGVAYLESRGVRVEPVEGDAVE